MEILVLADALRRASAWRVNAVFPYFGYARQDKKGQAREPITSKLVANLLETAGVDRVITVDLHAGQIQGFFDIPVDHLNATPVILKHIVAQRSDLDPICVVSPDTGNVKAAGVVAQTLDADFAIVDKRRQSGSRVESANIIGDVKDKTVVMVDDMITTAGTICEAAKLVVAHKAKGAVAACTHPVLVGMAMERIAESPIDKVIVCDTIPCGSRCRPIETKLTELSVAELLGEAIHRIHHNQSVSSLFKKKPQ